MQNEIILFENQKNTCEKRKMGVYCKGENGKVNFRIRFEII